MAMLSMVKEHDAYSSTEARWKRRFHSGIARAGSPVMVTFLTGGSSSSVTHPVPTELAAALGALILGQRRSRTLHYSAGG
jgi:hypothetical protein